MKERPIIFSTEMVKAILEGRKTQTRRVIKACSTATLHDGNQPEWVFTTAKCPYGQVGDRLWLKETWWKDQSGGCWGYKADGIEWPPPNCGGKSMSSMFMPRWASRLLLEITEVRVQRCQEIWLQDAMAEGCSLDFDMEHFGTYKDPITKFRELWDSLNAKRGYSWEINPWVWVINFKRVEEASCAKQ
jgi:hypothetical protein